MGHGFRSVPLYVWQVGHLPPEQGFVLRGSRVALGRVHTKAKDLHFNLLTY